VRSNKGKNQTLPRKEEVTITCMELQFCRCKTCTLNQVNSAEIRNANKKGLADLCSSRVRSSQISGLGSKLANKLHAVAVARMSVC